MQKILETDEKIGVIPFDASFGDEFSESFCKGTKEIQLQNMNNASSGFREVILQKKSY